eukprot:TRINITY_DN8165_c0_g1_i2.p1 TRINITY_DN8165_c0_g1~~TRINITY_DN8165_c0_g1_i2.p1  ORF type:complete len:1791 (+),score=260.54 TRINITY_DN8165_c0_g1_i2:117-5375(+)
MADGSSVLAKKKHAVLSALGSHLGGPDALVEPKLARAIVRALDTSCSEERLDAVLRSLGKNATCAEFVNWLFDERLPVASATIAAPPLSSPSLRAARASVAEERLAASALAARLQRLTREHPYIEPGASTYPHPLHHWVERFRESLAAGKLGQAQEDLRRVAAGLEVDLRQTSEAFRRFDTDASGHLDSSELRYMCAYLGWYLADLHSLERSISSTSAGAKGSDASVDVSADAEGSENEKRLTLADFQHFVGNMGGVQQLFEQRRLRIGGGRRDVCEVSGLSIGARVRAHFYVHGKRSKSWAEAQVLDVRVERPAKGGAIGPPSYGVLLEFGFGRLRGNGAGSAAESRWRARQVVPPSWVLSSVEDASTAAVLREVGILDEHQAFWALLLPDSELRALRRLESCQRVALANVRAHSTVSHEEALPVVRDRFAKLGFGERELQAVLSWTQDLAPVVVHVHLDTVGQFLEVDEFYRNQFETGTSCGALDSGNVTRIGWEKELFGNAYEGCKPFDRCKYGALNVMNDYRGVVSARGYGDSYLVLKDVRLRCTFASCDSGGIAGSRLAVLDKYAHVLKEYTDDELRGIVGVAMAAGPVGDACGSEATQPKLLRGSSSDPTMEWITIGFPDLQQAEGCYYYEVLLERGTSAAQVGLLSSDFVRRPFVESAQGVGDDPHGWAIDGQNCARWHAAETRAYERLWPSEPSRSRKSARQLSQDVVVGVCADLTARTLHFSTNGDWDSEPAFNSQDLPSSGVPLYPAISLMGRASFNFGPGFRYKPPATGPKCGKWPGIAIGVARADMPHVGNEESIREYKEVQIHGEVSLKRNVQRLVACNKYRNMPKEQRSMAIRVCNAASCDGVYHRTSVHEGFPLYQSDDGAKIYFDRSRDRWRIQSKDADALTFQAPRTTADGADEPPRSGWVVPDELRGALPEKAIFAALEASGFKVPSADVFLALRCDGSERADQKSSNRTILRSRKGRTLGTELAKIGLPVAQGFNGLWRRQRGKVWPESGLGEAADLIAIHGGKLLWGSGRLSDLQRKSSRSFVASLASANITARLGSDNQTLGWDDDALWSRAVDVADWEKFIWSSASTFAVTHVMQEFGVRSFCLFATEHPYEAKAFEATQEISSPGAAGLRVYFSSRCSTYDSCSKLQITTGGLSRNAAGPGARVELSIPEGGKVLGTVVSCERGRTRGSTWKVRLDRRRPWPALGETVEGQRNTSGDAADGETAGTWHECKVAEVLPEGRFRIEWSDGHSSDQIRCSNQLRCLSTRAGELLQHDLEDLPRYVKSANKTKTSFALCQDDVSAATVLYAGEHGPADEQGVRDKCTVGDEIGEFALDERYPLSPISIASFVASGPAQASGVAVGWFLDLAGTMAGPSRARLISVFNGIEGVSSFEDKQPLESVLHALFNNLDEVARRLNTEVRKMTDVTIFFISGSLQTPATLLPEIYLTYPDGQLANTEIGQLDTDGKHVTCGRGNAASRIPIQKVSKWGRAWDAGVRPGWMLDVAKTIRLNDGLGALATEGSALASPRKTEGHKKATSDKSECSPTLSTVVDEDSLASLEPAVRAATLNPDILLNTAGITLAIIQPNPTRAVRFTASGRTSDRSWKEDCKLIGDTATFCFSTDGDGASEPETRWGVWALAVSQECREFSRAEIDALEERLTNLQKAAVGLVGSPEVRQEGWDEARLRALCRTHGWEFEWMTEDGERRRRAQERFGMQRSRISLSGASLGTRDEATPDGASLLGTAAASES